METCARQTRLVEAFHSEYEDVEGVVYHCPGRIPNGRQISPGDTLVFFRSAKSGPNRARVFGTARVRELRPFGHDEFKADLEDYWTVRERLSFLDLGGDSWGNRQHAMNEVSADFVQKVREHSTPAMS